MKIHLICDPVWSTGVIAKDLMACIPDKDLHLHHWGHFREFPDDEVLICFTLTICTRWPHTRKRNSIHVCCGPCELEIPDVKEYFSTKPPLFFAGVSNESRDLISHTYAYTLPASARAGRFTRGRRPGKRIAGFVGNPNASSSIKRPEWFLRICRLHGLTPVFSNTDYTYESMQNFYDGIDYLFVTSSTEGGPLGPFEAALCGVPVISTKVGFWGECGMGGYFSDPDDPAIGAWLACANELSEKQHEIALNVSTEKLAPIWRSAIDLVARGI